MKLELGLPRLRVRVKPWKLLFGMITAAAALCGQSWYPHHNFTIGVGAAQPRADLKQAFSTRPAISVGYGYRFARYFQADAGWDTVFGAAGTKVFEQTALGYSRIRDYQFFIPFGGRAILPIVGERLLFSAGGGGTYMRYSERLHQPSDYYQVDCVSCTSRSGWGSYGLADISASLDRGNHFRLGVVGKVIRGHTEGEMFGNIPPIRTTDHWINIFAQFGFSF